MADSSR